MANQFIQTGTYKNILVIGAETLHPVIDYQDPNTCILFGDGAGAIVVTRAKPEESSTVLGYHALSDGTMGSILKLSSHYKGGAEYRPNHENIGKNTAICGDSPPSVQSKKERSRSPLFTNARNPCLLNSPLSLCPFVIRRS